MPSSANSSSVSTERLRAVLAAAQAERERRRKSVTQRFFQFRDDPAGFVENGLLGFLWSKQREVCASVAQNRRTAVQSCHGVGKTALAARIAAWWISVHEPGEAFVVSMAPTGHQVRALLWRELNRVHDAGHLAGRMNQIEWFIGNELVAYGRSPADNDGTAIQGVHARRVLVIGDEACGLSKTLLDAADSLISNDDSRILLIGNPDDPQTEFASVCKPGSGWNVIRISAFDSPNFSGEEVPAWLNPLLVGKVWVEEKRKSWGEESPIYKSKVLGLFPEDSADGLIPLNALREACIRNLVPPEGAENELGVDVSRFGGDATVIYQRRGPRARRLKRTMNRDLMSTVGMVLETVRETGARRVKIDDIGLGGGVTDRLAEIKRDGVRGDDGKISRPLANCEVCPINVSERPVTEEERFRNRRAELNWAMRVRFTMGDIDIDEQEDQLLAQAGQMKYLLTSTGHIQIEAKADMKKRTKGVSPDDWDALVLAFAKPSRPTTMTISKEALAMSARRG